MCHPGTAACQADGGRDPAKEITDGEAAGHGRTAGSLSRLASCRAGLAVPGRAMRAPPLPGALAALAPLLDHYGYLAIAGLIFLEDFGVPVPGETALIAGAAYAGAGRLNIVMVGLIAVAAAILGDNIGYLIGRLGGRALVLRWGKYVLLTPQRLDKAEDFFSRHGGWVITIARFLEVLRQANGIVAGISGMPWRRFLAFNALGAVLWVALWTTIGELAGNHIAAIYSAVTRYSLYVLIAVGVAILALIGRHLARHRRARHEPGGRRPGSGRGVTGEDARRR
jgi:membrane protein DedA with SNARE-associated domain